MKPMATPRVVGPAAARVEQIIDVEREPTLCAVEREQHASTTRGLVGDGHRTSDDVEADEALRRLSRLVYCSVCGPRGNTYYCNCV